MELTTGQLIGEFLMLITMWGFIACILAVFIVQLLDIKFPYSNLTFFIILFIIFLSLHYASERRKKDFRYFFFASDYIEYLMDKK